MYLVRFVTLLALLVASLAMTGGHAAMATPVPATEHGNAAAMGDHCAEMLKGENGTGGQDQGSRNVDCMIACSGLPVTLASQDVVPVPRPMRHHLPLVSPLDGHDLQADTPPPRSLDA